METWGRGRTDLVHVAFRARQPCGTMSTVAPVFPCARPSHDQASEKTYLGGIARFARFNLDSLEDPATREIDVIESPCSSHMIQHLRGVRTRFNRACVLKKIHPQSETIATRRTIDPGLADALKTPIIIIVELQGVCNLPMTYIFAQASASHAGGGGTKGKKRQRTEQLQFHSVFLHEIPLQFC